MACWLALITLPGASQANPNFSQQAITFAQAFYDWYLPVALHTKRQMASAIAIKQRPEIFDSTLLRALRCDAAAQTTAVGEIDGLDFDPFLNAQDPPAHYRAIRTSGTLVTVVGFDQEISKPLVTLSAEVQCNGRRCIFKNFHYPASGAVGRTDLMSTLHTLHPNGCSTTRF